MILDISQTNVIDLTFKISLTTNLNYKYRIWFLEPDSICIYNHESTYVRNQG